MIIRYNNEVHLKNTLEEFVTTSVNFHHDIQEKELYDVILSDFKNRLSGDIACIDIQPEVNLYKPRENWGWKWSTLKYLANSDEFSLFLPAAEPLATKSEVKDIKKNDPEEDLIPVSKTELLRDLKQLDIQLSKLIKKVEGGQW